MPRTAAAGGRVADVGGQDGADVGDVAVGAVHGAEAVRPETIVAAAALGVVGVAARGGLIGEERLRLGRLQQRVPPVQNGGPGAVHVAVVPQLRRQLLLLLLLLLLLRLMALLLRRDFLLLQGLSEVDEDVALRVQVALETSGLATACRF